MNSEYWKIAFNLLCSEIWNLLVRFFFFVTMTEFNTWIMNTSEYALNEPWISFSTSSPGNCCHWEIPFVIHSCPIDKANRNSTFAAGFSRSLWRNIRIVSRSNKINACAREWKWKYWALRTTFFLSSVESTFRKQISAPALPLLTKSSYPRCLLVPTFLFRKNVAHTHGWKLFYQFFSSYLRNFP